MDQQCTDLPIIQYLDVYLHKISEFQRIFVSLLTDSNATYH